MVCCHLSYLGSAGVTDIYGLRIFRISSHMKLTHGDTTGILFKAALSLTHSLIIILTAFAAPVKELKCVQITSPFKQLLKCEARGDMVCNICM